jgi:hypothetical protein
MIQQTADLRPQASDLADEDIHSIGSNSATTVKSTLSSGSNSVVECDLAKVEVAGSNPVSRSSFFCSQLARAPQMDVFRYGTLVN